MTDTDSGGTTHVLTMSVPHAQKDELCGLLLSLGLSGFVEGSVDCDIPFEYGEDHLSRDYYVEHDQGSPFVFYGASRRELEERLELVMTALESREESPSLELQVTWAEMNDSEWKESWKESFRPLAFGDELVVLPPWVEPAQFAQKHKLIMNPGMAFGTGQHETTQLCLKLYLQATPRQFSRVFDVGTGSGILAMVCRLYGCKQIVGCDIDPDSVRIATENALENGLDHLRFVSTPLADIHEPPFDLVFANIQAKPLTKILHDVVRLGSAGSTFIFSGILEEECEEFLNNMRLQGLRVQRQIRQGDWMGFIATI